MGGLLHLFEINQGSMARKILTHKQHVDGLEAPRNSLELQMKTSPSCCAVDGLYSYEVEEDWSEKKCYPIEASMKRLINEEISKQSHSRKNAPSIVARLMGVDMLPLDTKSVVSRIDKKNESRETKFLKKEKNESSSVAQFSSNSNPSWGMELNINYPRKERETNRLSNGQNFGKPRPREHPQEEELQKFKKEFEAWQAARFNECSRVVKLDSIPVQLLAQENIMKQKAVLNPNSGITAVERPVEPEDLTLKSRPWTRGSLRHHEHKMELIKGKRKESFSSRNRTISKNLEHSSLINYDQKLDKSSAPSRIVILKPGPDRIFEHEESWSSSSGTLEDRGSMEDFLEEVKERLKREVQGKNLRRGSIVRGSGIETPFKEKPSDPKEIAQHIAKQVRESVTQDLGMHLLRSESTRSYRSEIQFNGQGSPEFINRDTRRILSERLRNVLKSETTLDVPIIVGGSSVSSRLDNEKVRLKETGDTSRAGNEPSYWEIMKEEQERQTRSFRHGDDDGVHHSESSPRNLIRSLSAPVSGTSFGKLLLEDRHILTGAHIRRKHEALENATFELKKRKKEIFNIKEKVSNMRYSFTLRGKLFGKKIQSTLESNSSEHNLADDIMGGPTVVMGIGERHIMENSTEVPPSPASVCSSSPQEEFWRPVDYLSPVSTPDVTMGEDNMPLVFKEISSNLNELRRQLGQLESGELERTAVEEDPVEFRMVELDDEAEGYIRDLLAASGLYHGSSDKRLLRWDPLTKLISNSVFEAVEESCRKLAKDDETTTRGAQEEKKVDHKLLYDLLNEALSTVLGPPVRMSRFRRKIISSSKLPPLSGKQLLERVWERIQKLLYPPNDNSHYSLDTMVARNLGSTPWSGLIDDEVNDLAKEVECRIIGDVIEEIVMDMRLL